MNKVNETESRLNKSIMNVATGGVLQFLTLLLNFVVRIVFVRVIGYSYLGISSLFTNILTVLSVADLGFGTSISISLYSALKKADKKQISGIITYYRKIYFIIGITVFMVGMVLRPFVSHIVNTDTPIPNLELYFFIYLVNLVSTYFVSYRHAIIKADQNNSVINTVQSMILLGKSIIELIVIVVFPHFMEMQYVYTTYLIVMVVATYVSELWCAHIAKKMYPYAFESAEISREEKVEISKNVKSLLLYKVCNAVNKSIDGILISILVSTTILGKYSNYTLIIGVLMGFGCLVSRNAIASLGNYVLTESKEKQVSMFYLINFVHIAIAAFFIVNYVGILQPFFHFVFGLDSTLSIATLVLTAIHIGFDLNYQVNELFRETTKMFRKIPYISAINLALNVILSIVLGHFFGLEGIIGGTLIAYFLTSFWFETFALFKFHLQSSSKKVWLKLAYAVVVIAAFSTAAFLITNYVQINEPLYKLAFSIGVSLVLSVGCIMSFAWFKEFKRFFEIARQAITSTVRAINNLLSKAKIQLLILSIAMVALVALVVARDLYTVEIDKLVFVILIFISTSFLRGEYFISYFLFLVPFHSGLPTGYTYILLLAFFFIKNIKIFKNWRLVINYLFIPTLVFVWELILSRKYGQMTPVTDALQVFSALGFAAFLLYDRKSISTKPLFVFALGAMAVGVILFLNWYKISVYVTEHTTNPSMKELKYVLTSYRFGDITRFIEWNEQYYLTSEYPHKVSMYLTENQNYLGFIMLSGIMSASYVLVKGRKIWAKPICLIIILICTMLGLYTGSKSYFICLSFFIFIFILSLSFDRKLNPLLALLLFGLIAVTAIIVCNKNEYINKMILSRMSDDSHRFSLIRSYFEAIFSKKEFAIFGVGATRLTELFSLTNEPPHNAVVQIIGGYGLTGFSIIFVGLVLTIIKGDLHLRLFKYKSFVALCPFLVFVLFSMTSQIFFPPNTLLYGLPTFYIIAAHSNEVRESKRNSVVQ